MLQSSRATLQAAVAVDDAIVVVAGARPSPPAAAHTGDGCALRAATPQAGRASPPAQQPTAACAHAFPSSAVSERIRSFFCCPSPKTTHSVQLLQRGGAVLAKGAHFVFDATKGVDGIQEHPLMAPQLRVRGVVLAAQTAVYVPGLKTAKQMKFSNFQASGGP